MKLIFLIIFLIIPIVSFGDELNINEKLYIKYSIQNDLENGTQELFVFKNKFKRIHKTNTSYTIEINNGEKLFLIDMLEKVATEMPNFKLNDHTSLPTSSIKQTSSSSKNNTLNLNILKNLNIPSLNTKPNGEEIILNKTCKIYKFPGINVSMWKNYPLKIDMKILDTKFIQKALEIKENIEITDNFFKIPQGIKLIDTGINNDLLLKAITDASNKEKSDK